MALYHVSAYGLPALKIATLNGVVLSWHAQQQAAAKGISLQTKDLSTFVPADWTLVELEIIGGIPVKIVARQAFDEVNDLVIVIRRKEKLIVTLWHNRCDDLHSTLDRSVYSKP